MRPIKRERLLRRTQRAVCLAAGDAVVAAPESETCCRSSQLRTLTRGGSQLRTFTKSYKFPMFERNEQAIFTGNHNANLLWSFNKGPGSIA